MIDFIIAAIMVVVIGFFSILALAGILILIVVFVGIPLALIVRKLMPDPLD